MPADAPQQSAENGQRECVVPGDGPKVLFDGGLETTVSCSPPAPFVSAKAQLAQRWSEDKASHGAGDPVAEGEEREEGASIGVPEEGGLEEEIRTPSAQDKHIGMEVVTATKLGGELDQKGGTFTSEAKTAIEGGLKVKDGAERAVEDQGDGGSGALESGREQPLFRPVADGSPGEGRGWQEPSQLPQAAATAILRLAEADRHPSICSSELSFVDVAAEQRAELPEDLGNEPPTDPIALGVLAVQFDLCCSPAAQPSNAAPPYAEKTAQDMRQTEMTEAEGPAAQAKDSAGRGQEESAGADGPEPGAGAPLVSADGVSDGGHSNATKGGEDSAGLGQSRADASTGRSEIQEVTEEGDALDSLQGAGQKYHGGLLCFLGATLPHPTRGPG